MTKDDISIEEIRTQRDRCIENSMDAAREVERLRERVRELEAQLDLPRQLLHALWTRVAPRRPFHIGGSS